jgi:hypothetical protein
LYAPVAPCCREYVLSDATALDPPEGAVGRIGMPQIIVKPDFFQAAM